MRGGMRTTELVGSHRKAIPIWEWLFCVRGGDPKRAPASLGRRSRAQQSGGLLHYRRPAFAQGEREKPAYKEAVTMTERFA